MEGKFVAYYRVSTARQGESGLGLEAQREAVSGYLNGGKWKLLQEFAEVETGKGSDALEKRPVLREAVAYAKKHKATLVIAKLDRLSRDVHFISGLMKSGVDFVAADWPFADKLMLHIRAVFAEHERDMISKRTKEALQRAKARGVILGNPNLQADNTKRLRAAQAFARGLKKTLKAYQREGMSQRSMVQELNTVGIKSARGGEWSLVQLQRVLARL